MREKVIRVFSDHGTLVQPDAAGYLLSRDDPADYAKGILRTFKEYPLILTFDDIKAAETRLESKEPPVKADIGSSHSASVDAREGKSSVPTFVEEETPAPSPSEKPRSGIKRKPHRPAEDHDSSIEVLKDVTGQSTCTGKVDDFVRCFKDRFKTIKKMLRQKRELHGTIDISRAKRMMRQSKLLCIVNDINVTKNGHKLVEVEDETGSINALINKESPLISDPLLSDEVVGLVGNFTRKGDLFIIEDIVRPDIPVASSPRRSEADISVAFVSDVHVGSKTFLREEWKKFVSWLGNGGKTAGKIKYMVISGDIVDGIGIYPSQEEELVIDDIYEQYEEFARLMEDVPDYMDIVILPGNHDAVRPAEPQPTFPSEITKLFDDRVLFVGNPCYFSIEGIGILAYHGRSMDDFVANVQSLSYEVPLEIMRQMLVKRHLAPIYGGKTPIAPECKDYLVIDEVPNIFVTGHGHSTGIGNYRGVTLINASAWQSQTSFQRMHNFNPDPAKVPIINLHNGRSTLEKFIKS